ncbi:MAG: lysine-2,3-aminomutase-like protein [Beijerinckiaceae bacterium]
MSQAKAYPASLASADALVAAGLVEAEQRDVVARVAQTYAIGVSATMADLIDRRDPRDPIARQFIPDPAELSVLPEERVDPIGDAAASPVEAIVHRYPDRVLLKLLHICPVYCRFCFRREVVGPGTPTHLSAAALDRAFAYIADHDEIWEVILTGGDPLVLSPRRLRDVFARLRSIAHVRIIRIHTRVPVVEPALVGEDLVAALGASGKTLYVVLHANHPREFTLQARAACGRLVDAGIPMLSQSVLLRGVNDTVETLAGLMRGFVEMRIKPYYLHHADLARGTGHFRVSIEEGRRLVRALHGRLSGLCQPHYVLDIPGGFGKVPIGWDALSGDETGYEASDFRGMTHSYPPAKRTIERS